MKNANPYFWLSSLGHVLFFLSFSLVFVSKPDSKKDPEVYIPAYIQQSSTGSQTPNKMSAATHVAPSPSPTEKFETSKNGILKPNPLKKPHPQSHLNEVNQIPQPIQPPAGAPPHLQTQHLDSDKSLDKPLLKLLYAATAANMVYPKIAIDFNEHGTVNIGFLVYPNGVITKITLLKSSGFDILDKAALDAVAAMSPVRYVDTYLKKPKFLAVDVVFK